MFPNIFLICSSLSKKKKKEKKSAVTCIGKLYLRLKIQDRLLSKISYPGNFPYCKIDAESVKTIIEY